MTRIILIIFTYILLGSSLLLAQDIKEVKKFELEGYIPIDTGLVTLISTKNYSRQTTRIQFNSFRFVGMISEPELFFLDYGTSWTGSFIIEPGHQYVECAYIPDRNIPPLVHNKAMKESEIYQRLLDSVFILEKKYDEYLDSLDLVYNYNIPTKLKANWYSKIRTLSDFRSKILLQYVKEHPNSYYAFLTMPIGRKPIYDSIYNSFSATLRNTEQGKLLYNNLSSMKLLADGAKFPTINICTEDNKQFSNEIFSTSNYTLVDFWYSYCSPCKKDFAIYKSLYQKYKDKGFNIIAISTDREQDKNNWLKTISNEQLPWIQYWDINGVESSKLGVYGFPTTFLVDNNGIILFEFWNPVELEYFLSENIK